MPAVRKPIALVIPWFGSHIKGGAEQQAWQVASRLAARGREVEVLTTCSASFSTDWSLNQLAPGETIECGVKVRRFLVDTRNKQLFDDLNRELLSIERNLLVPGISPVEASRASIWKSENINSAQMEYYLRNEGGKYDRFLFMQYLYGLTLKCLPLVAENAWLQPCLHDEAYAYLPDVASAFHSAKGLLFNSHGEMLLAEKLFGPGIYRNSYVVGEGIETINIPEPGLVSLLPNSIRNGRFVLCLGRRCREKGTDDLVSTYREFRHNSQCDLILVLAGPGERDYSDVANGVVDLALVSEQEKVALLSRCAALLLPSLNESFSRVLFEAWSLGRPAVVHRDCLATSKAMEHADGGWIAGPKAEWVDRLRYLNSCGEQELEQVGARGRAYSSAMADWDVVISRYEDVFAPFSASLSKNTRKQHLRAVHQLLPSVSYGDAISNHAFWIKENLQRHGFASEIFALATDRRIADKCRPFSAGLIQPDDELLYHHSIGSELTSVACAHPGPKWFIYHNITPPEFFRNYSGAHARLLRNGREQMWTLANEFTRSVGVSAYNAEELQMYGFVSPTVLPIAFEPSTWNVAPDENLTKLLSDGKRNLLYVGRYSPNKCQHDLVEAFAHYLEIDADSRLILVGSTDVEGHYLRFLRETINRLGLNERVLLCGHVSIQEIYTYYRCAHVFWSMSEHEGFCVPLVEAMWFGVPIVAFSAAAVSETIGGAGVTFQQKHDLTEAAALTYRIVTEQKLREAVLKAQRTRRETFSSQSALMSLLRMVA